MRVTYLLTAQAGHAAPGGTEGDAREVDSEADGAGHGADRRRDPVAPRLGKRERLKKEDVRRETRE